MQNMCSICPRTTDAAQYYVNKHNAVIVIVFVQTRGTPWGTCVSESSFLPYTDPEEQTVLYRYLYQKASNRLIKESSKIFDKSKEPVNLKSVD